MVARPVQAIASDPPRHQMNGVALCFEKEIAARWGWAYTFKG